MSTDISTIMVAISGGQYISLSGMKNGQRPAEDLADFVKRIRHEKDLSQRDVERRSGGPKEGISKGYIGQIENRDVLGISVTPQKLRALAIGLDESEDDVFAIARGVNGNEPSTLEKRFAVMFRGWDEASEEERAKTLAAVEMIAESFQRRRNQKK